MQKLVVCLCAYLIVACSFKAVTAGEANSSVDELRVANYINNLYHQIDFSNCEHVSYDVFAAACKGYLNLRNAGKLNNEKEVVTICDMSRGSTEKRMWVIDLTARRVLFNTYVAHGQGTGEDCAQSFSNNFDSHQTSLGFYVTAGTYSGDHGLSLKLNGMDNGYNDAAMDRGIVVHGADYVSDKFITENNRLGRSWGCPAVPEPLKIPIINAIKEGTCLFIYFPEHNYMASSFWLNRKVSALPEGSIYDDVFAKSIKPACKQRVIQYVNNGKVDSTVVVPISN